MRLWPDYELLKEIETISKKFASSGELLMTEEDLHIVRKLKQRANAGHHGTTYLSRNTLLSSHK